MRSRLILVHVLYNYVQNHLSTEAATVDEIMEHLVLGKETEHGPTRERSKLKGQCWR